MLSLLILSGCVHFFQFMFLTLVCCHFCLFFFFNDTATTEIYTLSLHDALPILFPCFSPADKILRSVRGSYSAAARREDRKSTRLNSSHVKISYAVFCLKKKKKLSV